ncbi:hypothetical protein OE88DRAFT_1649318 [Heliocybe sulcata]|uniref:Uncharacterized protein n=1 Tax=Heliocybe sulcata TaxID=5364 RepID=A0A5C3MJ10_9AGAM|nr:hypothetical protein OE88DRAFT_1649318 [Heliocybe sulcata]
MYEWMEPNMDYPLNGMMVNFTRPGWDVLTEGDRATEFSEQWFNDRMGGITFAQSVKTFVHPVIRLILNADRGVERLVGSSHGACHLCLEWTELYNETYGVHWECSADLGRSDATWAYPWSSSFEKKIRALTSQILQNVLDNLWIEYDDYEYVW